MGFDDYPQRYRDFNSQQTKKIAIVVSIPGVDVLSSTPVFTRVRYGDPNTVYGAPGLVYGGLRRVPGVRDILKLEGSNLSLSQRVEPEQGRGSVSTMTIAFIDHGGYMTRVVSPGVILDDILGKPVTVKLGYQDTSYPEDYFTVFRGYVTSVDTEPGQVILGFSDANLKRRSDIFQTQKTTLASPIDGSVTTIPVTKTAGFYRQIIGPDSTYDSGITTYVKIEDEICIYPATGISGNSLVSVTRGSRGTQAVPHAAGVAVQTAIQIQGAAMDLALKLMLSGWNGPYLENSAVYALADSGDITVGVVPNAIYLPMRVDAVDEIGAAVGDYITVTGAAVPANNKTVRVIGFDFFQGFPNQVILCDHTFTAEGPGTPAVFSIRSQYDTFPVETGLGLAGFEVDVARHQKLAQLFYAEDILQGFFQATEKGKDFIEKEIYLVEGAYSITRFGKVSVNATHPPLADERLLYIDQHTIKNPESISIKRALNNRRYFPEIRYDYDADDKGTFLSTLRILDTDSLNVIGVSTTLAIQSRLLKSNLSGAVIANRRGKFLLSRYKNAAFEIQVNVNWEAGSQIEVGDVIGLVDEGTLKIPNFKTGGRNLATALFEVIDRPLDIQGASATLRLLSNVGFDVNDRYATIAPSSKLSGDSTASALVIQDSYGDVFHGSEQKKWQDYLGLPVVVHDYGWTRQGTTVLQSVDAGNNHQLNVSPALSFTPSSGDILEVAPYPDSTDPNEAAVYKSVHCFLSPSIPVVSGVSVTQFTVSLTDAAKFIVGLPILIHNASYSVLSPEVTVDSVSGTTVTVRTSLGFTPASGQLVELVGFADNRGAYRLI